MLADSEVVDRVLRGDGESFGILVQRYERTVLGIAWAELRDLHAAEDVAQAALVTAFQRLASLQEPSSFGAWLIQITRRQVIDATRKRQTPVMAWEQRTMEPAASHPPAIEWIEQEYVGQLLNRLPDHERVLIGLRYFDGHSVAEIAQILARPVGSVTKQLSRAIGHLRTFLEQEKFHES